MNGPLRLKMCVISWSDKVLILCTNLLSVDSNKFNVVDLKITILVPALLRKEQLRSV